MSVHVGIDGGANSVGLAAVVLDEEGMPASIPHLVTVKHDGGKDDAASSQTANISRKKSGGIARRERNRKRNRKAQRRQLQERLVALGYPDIDMSNLHTYEAWEARIELCEAYIEDAERRGELIAIALQHMERHRGWANAWLSVDHFLDAEFPTDDFEAAAREVREDPRFNELRNAPFEFQSDFAVLALHNEERLRPRRPKNPSKAAVKTHHLLGRQRREDVAREWRHICETQELPETQFRELGTIAFGQEKPRVPRELIGREWIPQFKGMPRASTCTMELQEFRIRQAVANLAVKPSPRSKERVRLTVEQQNLLVDTLSGISRLDDQPTWRALAELIDVEPQLLVHAEPDEQLSAKAPINKSVVRIHSLPKKHPVSVWWLSADERQRSVFVAHLGDPGSVDTDPDLMSVQELLSQLGDDDLAKLDSLNFDSGRANHCVEVLRMLNAEIATSGDTYVNARNRLFNDGENMVPEREDLDSPAAHPTLQRVIPPVRRFLLGVEKRVGTIEQVTIEHVRESFLGLDARAELQREQRANRKQRELAAEHFTAATGIENPRRSQIRKLQLMERQNMQCLYCGSTLSKSLNNVELDHIVPRAGGGSNRQANIAAVCQVCNQLKGRDPFQVFADSGIRPGVSLDGAMARVDALIGLDDMRLKQRRLLKSEMKQRLRQTTEDTPVDERALASTAYAATDLRNRIMATYGDISVPVYRGEIVSAARKASGIDKRMQLRPGLEAKSRLDRRHHAVDAAVAAMLNPSVARTLAEREMLRREVWLSGDDERRWKDYTGSSPTAQAKFEQWKTAMHKLADLIVEKLAQDEVHVMQPVRYSARHAQLHEAERLPHRRKKLGAAWSAEELRRVVDPVVWEQLWDESDHLETLQENDQRSVRLSNGRTLGAGDDVYVFPDGAARIALPHQSSAKLGATAHHARIYEVPTRRGTVVEMIRVWAADLRESAVAEGDLFECPLPPTSAAVRRSTSRRLRQALESNEAKQIGWIAIGDELMLDLEAWGQVGAELQPLTSKYEETHWELVGLEDDGRLKLRPLTLSIEGVDEEAEPELAARMRRGFRFSVSRLFAEPSTKIVRRSALGEIRERGTALPVSWHIDCDTRN